MAPATSTVVAKTGSSSPYQLDAAQTLRASTALLRKIQSDQVIGERNGGKASLLADADEEDVEDEVPVWLVLTTKKHIIEKKRLKPGKIILPHPYLDADDANLRVCLITADPQRNYKDLIDGEAFPAKLRNKIKRVIGLEKLKAKYKAYEARRQLLSEYDVFLADDRIITYLPGVLGKVFYKGGSKRPVPVTIEGKRQNTDEQGHKRRKLSEGGTKVVKSEVKPQDVAHEIERTLSAALVHLAPSTTTAVKVGKASQEPDQLQANIETVVSKMVEQFVPHKWRNVRSIHIKGPETAALPIWLADELWEKQEDVLDEPLPVKEKGSKKRKLSLAGAGEEPETIEIPGPDGKMRTLENPAEKAEKEARKAALKKQKEDAKKVVGESTVAAADGAKKVKAKTTSVEVAGGSGKKPVKKWRVKAADLI
ncbi:ribosomal protein L1 [Teratosphaeria nubilosa]|uniref:Ribosomal protein L1 n=1 Tax=Teratosphaeria nubilosa TaxID=161662 RepID=A0A6G1LHX5_9PEZI|nr:ribosomal protein L1 [Teratosphaeria nubilosa]